MSGLSLCFISVSALSLIGIGCLWAYRWSVTPMWLKALLLFLVLLGVVAAYVCRRPRLFTSEGLVMGGVQETFRRGRYGEIVAEWSFERVQGIVLGRYLAEARGGRRCVVVRGPLLKNSKGEAMDSPMVSGIKEGMNGSLEIVNELEIPMSLPSLPKAEPGQPAPVPLGIADEQRWSAEALDGLLQTVGEFDVLIVCVPLPEGCIGEYGVVNISGARGRDIVLATGSSDAIRLAVLNGSVLAGVGYKPGVRCNEKVCPPPIEEAFDMRYVLLTSETVKAESEKEVTE